jgi:putative endonuclease
MKAKDLGYAGEEMAVEFLKKKGYEILESNFTIRGGEIDVIARTRNQENKKTNNILVFVEVKTRTGDSFGDGEESVNSQKKRRLLRAIDRYLDKHYGNGDPDYRVDIVEIELYPLGGKLKNITHFEDIEL